MNAQAIHFATFHPNPAMTRSSATERETCPLLLQPILYGGREATDQYIGGGRGGPDSSADSPCQICGAPTQSLARFRTASTRPERIRLLHVVACAKASCWNALFADMEGGNVCLGGKGVVACTMSKAAAADDETLTATAAPTAAPTRASTNDEWGASGGENTAENDMESLEAQLAAIEGGSSKDHGSMESVDRKPPTTTSTTSPSPITIADAARQEPPPQPTTVFPRYELYAVKEPNAPRSGTAAAANNRTSSHHHHKDSAKIQAMLERYLAEETDEEIRSALNRRHDVDGGDFGLVDYDEDDDEEDDEKTPTADQILHDYKERLRRAPRQVIRCGGTPLWSAPLVLPKPLQRNDDEQDEDDEQNEDDVVPKPRDMLRRFVPACEICGEDRSFAAQVLPTLLHSLQVDQTPPCSSSLQVQFTHGAMDFGNIMLYTCAGCTCCNSDKIATAFCIVQKPVDEVPTKARTFKLVNAPDEMGSSFPNDCDDQGSTFTDECVDDDDDDDDYTVDGEDDGDEPW